VNGAGPAKTQDDVRASSSGRHVARKAAGRSRDRGCKGHRILGRVLVDGRHPGSSRAILFHEKTVTAVSASSSRRSGELAKRELAQEREGEPQLRERGRRDRGVRGSIESGAVGRKRPRPQNQARTNVARESGAQGSACLHTIRQSGLGCRETPGPSVMSHGAQTP
jgi:hypothetical protein